MTNAEFPPPSKPVNLETQRSFRRQVGWQVYAPIGLGLVALIAAVAGLAWAGLGDPSLWADLSIVLLAIPACLLGVILLAALLAAGYGVARLTALLPPYTFQVQRAMNKVQAGSLKAADVGAAPVVALRSAGASAKAGARVVGRLFRRGAGDGDAANG